MDYQNRNLSIVLESTTAERPLVYLNGPRQVGKSTLSKNIKSCKEINYITFDSPIILAGAKSDPAGFINSLPLDKLNIIDEVQKCPEIFNYLKISIDENRMEGNAKCLYLLTGSANLLALPKLSNALVGRMSVLTLLPFSTSEYMQTGVNFVKELFNDNLIYEKYDDYDVVDLIKHATYPELVVNPGLNMSQWFDDYLTTLLQRDVKNIIDIRNPEKLLTMLSFLAMRVGGLINNVPIAQEMGLDRKTYDRYKSSVLNTFVVFEIRPWSPVSKTSKRLTKAPKLFFNDTNLLTYVMRRDLREIFREDRITMGRLFENFIATEIMKNVSAAADMDVYHFRTSDNKEVDFVIEKYNGDILGIEVKLSKTVHISDFSGLKVLKEIAGNKFSKGVVIYTGSEIVPMGEGMFALPMCYLWRGGKQHQAQPSFNF